MFEFWRPEEHKTQPCPNEHASQSWHPSSVVSSPSSSRPSTPSDASSSSYGLSSPTEILQYPSHISPAESAGFISVLMDKSAGELRKLVSDREAYQQLILLPMLLKYELCKENSQLAEENLQKEPRIMELRNQCAIIRTAEFTAAQEKINELHKQKQDILHTNSPALLLQRIQEATNKSEG